MDLLLGWGFSGSDWNINTPTTLSRIIRKKALHSEPEWVKKRCCIPASSRWAHVARVQPYGNPVTVPRKTRKNSAETPPAIAKQWLDADENCCCCYWCCCKGCGVRKRQKAADSSSPCRLCPWQLVRLWSRTKTTGSGTCEQPPRHNNVNNTHISVQVKHNSTQRRFCTEKPTPCIPLAAWPCVKRQKDHYIPILGY